MLDSSVMRLLKCFPGSFINNNGEFIAHKFSNTYFSLSNCETEEDLNCKVIEWFSRAAYKTQPYRSDWRNKKFHEFMKDGINKFLGTQFTGDDFYFIYTYLGNAIKHDLTVWFVRRGYDMAVIEDYIQERENEKER